MLARLLLSVLVSVGLGLSGELGADAQISLRQMYHKSWTPSDGAPNNIESVVKGPDGFLWLATDSGLFRFDGVTFQPYTPPTGSTLLSKQFSDLISTREGSLWISYLTRGLTRIKNGTIRNYTERDGLIPNNAIDSLLEDRQGTVWAGGPRGLEKITDPKAVVFGPEQGLPDGAILCLAVDHDDNLWALQRQAIMVLPQGSQRFVFAASRRPEETTGCAGSWHGSLWTWGTAGTLMRLQFLQGKVAKEVITRAIRAPWVLTEASDGAVWVGTNMRGVLRFYLPGHPEAEVKASQIESFSMLGGLTGNFAFHIAEDDEGSTWVVTPNGLDQFRPVPFRAVDIGQTAAIVLPQGRSGPPFIVSSDHVVDLTNGRPMPLPLRVPAWTRSLYQSSDGTLWIGSNGRLWKYAEGRFSRQPLPPGVDGSHRPPVLAIVEDASHGIWISLGSGFGLFRWDGSRWTKGGGYSGLPSGIVMAADRDSEGGVWFGYRSGQVARVLNGHVQQAAGTDSLDLGIINVFAQHDSEVWAGGERGIALCRAGKFLSLRLADTKVIQGVTGAAFTADGALWINEMTGVVRVDSAELNQWRARPDYAVEYSSFDSRDGLRGLPHPLVGLGSARVAPDGRLYIATRTNLQWIDPLHLPHNDRLPQVWVAGWKTDRAAGSWPSAALHLEPRAANLEIDYVATSLLIPDRVNFRYKLEGFDGEWVNAGTRRQAFYPKLSPGQYTFRVTACNDSGVWNNSGASLVFTIPPTFIQTIWFEVLCVAALACVAMTAYRLRMRQVAGQIRRSMYERMAEREDIARDLHDTFFQNIQGLLLRFNTATSKLSGNEPARGILEDTLRQSDEVMLEGRRLLSNLHDKTPRQRDLPAALAEYGQELQKGYEQSMEVLVNGNTRFLHPVAFEEISNIGKEALSNAFRHSGGRSIEAELTYDTKGFRMNIRDDGTGIDPDILEHGRREGHLGLPGMRERAKKIGAHLEIWSRGGTGTELELRVHSHIAYAAENRDGIRSRLRDFWAKRRDGSDGSATSKSANTSDLE